MSAFRLLAGDHGRGQQLGADSEFLVAGNLGVDLETHVVVSPQKAHRSAGVRIDFAQSSDWLGHFSGQMEPARTALDARNQGLTEKAKQLRWFRRRKLYQRRLACTGLKQLPEDPTGSLRSLEARVGFEPTPGF